MSDDRDRIYFPDGEYTFVIIRAGGVDKTISMRDDHDPRYCAHRTEMLLWAQIAATRQQTDVIAKLVAGIDRMALGAHDTADAVRDQTEQMRADIQAAKDSAPNLSDILNDAPAILAKLKDAGIDFGLNGATITVEP